MIRIPKNYLIYESSYNSEVPINQIYVHNFKSLPSIYKDFKKYDITIMSYFLKSGFHIENDVSVFSKRGGFLSVDQLLVNYETKIMLLLKTTEFSENDGNTEISFFYNVANGPITHQINFNEITELIKPIKRKGIGLIKSEMGHLDIQDYELTIPDIDIELNYGTSFLKVHETIVKRLNTRNDKGIILFHGEPGTGKTSYLKYLTKLIDDKEVLFIPPSMAESLSEPSIIPFLMEHSNSILIIEDAEKVIADRENNGSSMGVSNILNLTDGILGDCLNIQIIATFNMKREKIDNALLRKGRLIAEHKFEFLNVENTNKLLKHLNKDVVVNEPMPLSDIYNIDEEIHRTQKNKQNIGFYK
jgi:hypothetical protein